jgi:hypothetical protein
LAQFIPALAEIKVTRQVALANGPQYGTVLRLLKVKRLITLYGYPYPGFPPTELFLFNPLI